KELTPKAKFMVLLSYQGLLDSHGSTVDQCEKKVDCDIDLHCGKPNPKWAEALIF
ncbi:hypothetical protein HOY82DRAFT_480014, partial [Tuber indicum]